MSNLDRFKQAQAGDYASALAEIRSGHKSSHWIWYVFPQLAGLGMSFESQHFGLQGLAEAEEYLRDPQLRDRLLTITAAAAAHLRGEIPAKLDRLMGSRIDALKLVSSMTLFAQVARRLADAEGLDGCQSLAEAAESILAAAEKQGYPACSFTLRQLTR